MKERTRFVTFCLAAGACAALLAGCGGGTSAQPYTQEQAQAILNSGAFTDDLEELDSDTIWALYGLESGGLSREALTESFVRRSAGATCEELALLTFADGDAAQAALEPMQAYLQDQIDANRDYRPAEIPKLEDAFLQAADNTVLLVVSNDAQAVEDCLN